MCIYAGGYAPRNAYVGLQLIPRHALRRRRNGMWLARISHIEEKTAAHEMANGCGTGSLVGMANLQMSQETREFIRAHAGEDVRELALHTKRDVPGLDLPFALDQIAGREIARTKLPQWAACEGIVYPPHLAMEQCSSQFTAEYKAQVAAQLVEEESEPTLVDLTGGFGVDFSAMVRGFAHGTYVERQERLCEVARHNLRELGLGGRADVVCGDGVDHLAQMPPATLIYLDPARRDEHGARTYAIEDCTPNALALRGQLLDKAPFVMIKLSPMLDWRKTIADFVGSVAQVHITATGNECKEIVVVLARGEHERVRVVCVNDAQRLEFEVGADSAGSWQRADVLDACELGAQRYRYEPNAAIMKAGAFGEITRNYDVRQIGANSHLFVSEHPVADFPGRAFEITALGTMNKRDVRQVLGGISAANVSVRNFPLTVQQLRRKLKLRDGGDVYLFATTVAGGHMLLRTRKLA